MASLETTDRPPVSRLAPSPTGALHLGNARSFLLNWALARQRNWHLLMRVEDLDGPRVKTGAADRALEILAWLGLDWDGEPATQSDDLDRYHDALRRLVEAGLAYPCGCTRSEIEAAASAPHADTPELRYPGTCRPASGAGMTASPVLAAAQTDTAWRVRVPDEPIEFVDQWAGPQRFNVQQEVGDFVIATKQGMPAYQLAVALDDARAGVTDVVRGDDLLSSTARQLWIYSLLDLCPPDRWWHAPLVIGPDGRRLAKRHGDTRIATYREAGVSAERVVGLLADWSGVSGTRRPMTAAAFLESFDPDRLPREAITFTDDDHAWLMADG